MEIIIKNWAIRKRESGDNAGQFYLIGTASDGGMVADRIVSIDKDNVTTEFETFYCDENEFNEYSQVRIDEVIESLKMVAK